MYVNDTVFDQNKEKVDSAAQKLLFQIYMLFLKTSSLSVSLLEEIDAWQKIAQEAGYATEAENKYIQSSALNPLSFADRFRNLWNSASFSSAKADLEKLQKETGITEKDILSLADGSAELAALLSETGMSAQFAAACFNKVHDGADGFSAITEDAPALDRVLHGMDESLQKVKVSESAYDRAMEADD